MGSDPTIDHLAVVREVRARMPAATNDQCVLVCNEVAKELRARGEDAGLLLKRVDQVHGTGPDGNYYAIDAIVYPDGEGYDCLYAAPEQSRPIWDDISNTFNTALVRPPFDSPDPPDPPIPPPTICPCQQELAELRTHLDAAHAEILARLVDLQGDLDGLMTLLMGGVWPVKVSHKYLGTMTGTVGPMR